MDCPGQGAGARVIAVELHPGRAEALRRRFGHVNVIGTASSNGSTGGNGSASRNGPPPRVDSAVLVIRRQPR
jgi:hypothetical protein